MALEIFKLVGRIDYEGQDKVDKGLDSTEGKLEKIGGGMEKFGGAVSSAGGTLTKWVTGPLVGGAAALGGLALKAGYSADEILDLSDITGLSTDALQEYRYVAERAGVSQDAVGSAAEGLTRRLANIEKGAGPGAEALEELGISTDEFMAMSQDDRMNTLISSLSEYEGAMDENTIASQLFGGAWKDLAPIIGMGSDEIDRLTDKAHESNRVLSGETLEAANEGRMAFDEFKGAISGAFFAIGAELVPLIMDSLIPAIENHVIPFVMEATEKIKEWIQWFQALDPPIQRLITAAIGIAGALGPVLMILGRIISLFGTFIKVLGVLNPVVLLIIGVVAALTAGFLYLMNTNEEFRETVMAAWERIQESAIAIFNFIREHISEAIAAVRAFVTEQLQGLAAFWDEHGAQVMEAVGNLFRFISTIVQTVMPVVLAIIKQVWRNIQGVIEGVINVIMGIIRTFSALLTGDFRGMWQGIQQIFTGALQAIWNFIQLTLMGRIMGIGRAFFAAFRSLFSGGMAAIRGLVSSATSAITGVFQAFGTRALAVIRAPFTAMRSFISSTLNAMTGRARSFAGGFVAAFQRIPNGIRAILNRVAQGFNNLIGSLNRFGFSIPSWVPGIGGNSFNLNIPRIPTFADGGVITSPTMGLLGETAGARPEIITPEKLMRQVVSEEGGQGVNNGDIENIVKSILEFLKIEVPLYVNDREIARATREANGKEFADARKTRNRAKGRE